MQQLKFCFQLATVLSLAGWSLLLLAPSWSQTGPLVGGIVVGLLALLYVYLVFVARPAGIAKPKGSFWSLGGVIRLFENPRVVLAGWVHFLAFDLIAALWIRADAPPHAIGHWWLVPIYLLTLMFGPAGLLAYLLLRFLHP